MLTRSRASPLAMYLVLDLELELIGTSGTILLISFTCVYAFPGRVEKKPLTLIRYFNKEQRRGFNRDEVKYPSRKGGVMETVLL
jgi:hypothetical protein